MIRAATVAVGLLVCATSVADGGLMKNVVFSETTALSGSAEIARRMFTPLAYRRVESHFADVRAQPIDVARETFTVYVPLGAPPEKGFGLLVFIPPWSEASLPGDWSRILDHHGLIFVSAANSGNNAGMLDRRVPLALLGYENVRRRYRIDADRVYVGGLSGGSRVALRVALAYPDVFRGALLNAGSDPIGGDLVSLPPAELFHRFQESTRIVFVTGERDEFNRHSDVVSETSLRGWCVFDLASVTMPRRGHEIANAPGLAEALKDLEAPRSVGADKQAECRAHLERELTSKVAAAQAALKAGDRSKAVEAVKAIDTQYGGVAEPAITRLQRELEGQD